MKTIKIISANRILKSMLVIFLLSGLSLLSSSVLWVPVPRPQRSVVIIGQGHSDQSDHKYYKHNNGKRNGNNGNRNNDKGRH